MYPKIPVDKLTKAQRGEIQKMTDNINSKSTLARCLMPNKCIICGKTNPFLKMEYDSNYGGLVCKSCQETTC